MTRAEALTSEAVTKALEELGLADAFKIVKLSVTDDGAGCARLESQNADRASISVCAERIADEPIRAVDVFKAKIDKYSRSR